VFKPYLTQKEIERLQKEGLDYHLKVGGRKIVKLKDMVIERWGGSPIAQYALELGGEELASIIHGHGWWSTVWVKLDMTFEEFMREVEKRHPNTRVFSE